MNSEDKDLDALKRFLVFADRTGVEDVKIVDEDAVRLDEVTSVMVKGAMLIQSLGLNANSLAPFLAAFYAFQAQDFAWKDKEFAEAVLMLDKLTEATPSIRAAYFTLIRFAFEAGLGFGIHKED